MRRFKHVILALDKTQFNKRICNFYDNVAMLMLIQKASLESIAAHTTLRYRYQDKKQHMEKLQFGKQRQGSQY